jgi:N-acetylglucosamine-6-phosphate deacetylase
MVRFSNIRIVTPDSILDQDLLVDDAGVIGGIQDRTAKTGDARLIDGDGAFAFPGMLDLLTHGYGHHFYGDADPGAIGENSRILPRHGVTGFAPSFLSQATDQLFKILEKLANQATGEGARVLGIHSEGPCINAPGAHDASRLNLPSEKLANEMIEAARGKLRIVTLAPELDGSREFVDVMTRAGVSLHLGHSLSPPDRVNEFADWGVRGVTHMYDVFFPAEVIEPGLYPVSLADALMAEPRLCLGLICDGVHTEPVQAKLLTQLSRERLFLETDSMKFTGLPPGRFEFYPGTWAQTAPDGVIRLDGGELAGSLLTSDKALKNLVEFTGIDLPRASHATSLNPARLVGMDKELGSLEIGKQADIVLLDPSDLSVLSTYVDGKQVFDHRSST